MNNRKTRHMANQQNSGKITIANIVSVVGVVLLLVFTFMGYSYMSGGELGWDILISIGITGFTVFLLWFLIKAKGAENYLTKWKKAEYAALVVYIIFALTTSIYGGIMHFFVVNDHKNNIKEYAEQDLAKIESMFNDFKEYEEDAISTTATGLRNATGRGQVCEADLNSFMEENRIEHTHTSAENYERIQTTNLIGKYESYYEQFKTEKEEIKSVVNSWSIMMIPTKANRIEKIATAASAAFTKLSEEAKLPIIRNISGKYTIEGYQHKEFNVDGGVESFQFRKAIREADGFSFTALLIVLLIHTLILFNYIVAYRTSTLDINDSEEDGGRIL